MNMKEIQQVMSDNTQDKDIKVLNYVSLYDYLGRSTAKSDDGIRVAELAASRGIKPGSKLLPEELQNDKYKSVATWPVHFLDSIYKRPEQVLVRQDQFDMLQEKVARLENKLNELINVTNSNVGDADDLPF